MEMKDRFIQLRREKQMTQAELAEALNVSRQAVSRWETGASIPSMDSLIELSKLYDVPVDYFMGKAVPANNPAVESSGSKSAVDSRACYMSRLKNALIIILARVTGGNENIGHIGGIAGDCIHCHCAFHN